MFAFLEFCCSQSLNGEESVERDMEIGLIDAEVHVDQTWEMMGKCSELITSQLSYCHFKRRTTKMEGDSI